MRSFITGANGFLGGHLLRALDGPVVALTRDQLTFIAAGYKSMRVPAATLCFGDLSDSQRIERILAEYKIDTVFHLAAQTEVGTAMADPVGTLEANVRGTWNILEACRRQGVKRVILSSSDKAYGRTAPPYREDLPLAPDRPYETSKACADMIARTYASAYKMSIAVTRCTNLYGPECMTYSTLIPNTIKRILSRQAPMIRNGGRMKRDWLFIEDAVDAYVKLAKSDYVGAINFGTGEPVAVIDVVRTILDIMGHKNAPIEDQEDKVGEIVDQWTDASVAREKLGWTAAHNLRKGLEKTIPWYRDNYKIGA